MSGIAMGASALGGSSFSSQKFKSEQVRTGDIYGTITRTISGKLNIPYKRDKT